MEKILHLEPTLIIGSVPFKTETVAKLLEQPIRFLAINPRTLADIYDDIRFLSRITKKEKSGDRLVRHMQKEFNRISTQGVRKRVPRIYCEAWPNPRISSPPWVAELVEICGGKMSVPAGRRVSEAEVASSRPEIIILAWAAAGKKSDPGRAYGVGSWKAVPAIVNRQVRVMRDELLNTPGPPLVEGARELFRIVQRDAGAEG